LLLVFAVCAQDVFNQSFVPFLLSFRLSSQLD
jgi:hypothetical protein